MSLEPFKPAPGTAVPPPAKNPPAELAPPRRGPKSDHELNGPPESRLPRPRDVRAPQPEDMDPEVDDLRKRGKRVVRNAQVRPTIK